MPSGALVLHEDRCFDPDPAVRRVARDLYQGTRGLPLVSPHGHVDASVFADDAAFPDPTALIVGPDHYLLRMLYSRGVPLESLGIPRRDGTSVESDPRKIWQLFAQHYYLFQGTPSGYWLDAELHDVFGIRTRLSPDTGTRIYAEIQEKLASGEFRPRALYRRFNIEVLATTDAAGDSLAAHRALRESGWNGRVIPTFRPDALFRIASSEWSAALDALVRAHGAPIRDYGAFIGALGRRRGYFAEMGATASDHGVLEPFTHPMEPEHAELLFQQALLGKATPGDQHRFQGHLLIEMARMAVDDGLVMQIHAGAFRDHNRVVARQFGSDRGGDIPIAAEFTRNLRPLLNAFGNDPRLTLILFTLDESAYSRELAPLAGHYPAVLLGPPWWFHDSLQGMTRFREQTTETAGIWNTAGFNDDTRAFCSIPARHDLSRRVDANFLARLVARHLIDVADAHQMARALAYDLARKAYRL